MEKIKGTKGCNRSIRLNDVGEGRAQKREGKKKPQFFQKINQIGLIGDWDAAKQKDAPQSPKRGLEKTG